MAEVRYRSDMTVKLVQSMGSDRSVVAAAKVSTGGVGSYEALETAAKEGLINFLMKNRHGTPFEHNSMTFMIEAPIFVYREFHRHRIGWSYNEESARYRQLEPVFYLPSRDRALVQKGKPGHYYLESGTDELYHTTIEALKASYEDAYISYEWLLEAGVAREVARNLLPVAIYSSMYATCNARSLMAFLSLRTKDARALFPSFPQREIEMVGEGMEREFQRLFPITHEAFSKHGRVSP